MRAPLTLFAVVGLGACGASGAAGPPSGSGDAGLRDAPLQSPESGAETGGRDASAADVSAGDAPTGDATGDGGDIADADGVEVGAPLASHRPPGLTTVFEYDFSAPLPGVAGGGTSGLVVAPPSYYMLDTTNEPSRYPGAWTPLMDPTAPTGKLRILQIDWPSGLWSGGTYQEPGAVGLGSSGSTTYTKYYLGIWSKLVSTSGAGGTGFELPYDGPGIKFLGYVSVGDTSAPPRGVYFLLLDPAAPNGGVSTGPFAIQMAAQIGNAIFYNLPQGHGGAGGSAAASTAPLVPLGAWVFYELYFQLDTMSGGTSNADGWFQCWIGGTLAFDYRNVQYRNATYMGGFYQWDGDLVWGGVSTKAKVRTDYQGFAYAVGAGQ